jgi:SAM-dependent methyltransferase
MPARTVLSVPIERESPLPERFLDDLRFPEALVSTLLERYTDPGDTVFDPFAGFGTVPRVAADLDRIGFGVEYDAEKVSYANERLEPFNETTVRHGDALELSAADLPQFECCLTSPPFATEGTAVDPLRDYAGESDYETYLENLRTVFERVGRGLQPGGRVLLEVSNLQVDGGVTTLAWDVAETLSAVLCFDGELIIAWEGDDEDGYTNDGTYGYGYDHSYCLVFTLPSTDRASSLCGCKSGGDGI